MSVAAERLPESIVRAAIAWQMRLRANAGSVELHGQLQAWLGRDARHQLAWERLQQMGAVFHASPLPEAAQTLPLLRRAEVDLGRRRALKVLGLGAAGVTLLAANAPPAWHADFSTAVGERRQIALADGGQVLLNTGSALDVRGRELLLRAGEALVDGARWQARCRFASCEGQQARVLLREHDGYSEIRVAHGQVQVRAGAEQRSLQAGEGLSVSALGMTTLGQGPLDPFAWARGLMGGDDIRLSAFLAEAGRYRTGWLGCDSAVAELRLSGVFRLDEPMQMLRNITHLLPVKIVERTRWWVRIVAVA